MTANTTVTTPPASATAAKLSSAAIIVYQILLLAVIFIRPELDPARKPISEYAIGRHGWVMVSAFLTAAAAYGCLFVAVRPAVRGVAGRIGLGVLGVCVAGTAGVGVFVADPVVTPLTGLTVIGTLHVVCGFGALVLLPFAALLLNLDLARGDAATAPVLRWTAGLPLAGLVLHWALSLAIPPEGWPPRFLFLTYAVWLIVLAGHIRRASGA
ncbi:DUF998 domain-containing protein [Actinomadura scrupuli]|uniref:DUF998 domain-containing protein n=1 Tax=Actinomadura scrupuli TaxID=559629 RepID=UPI003D969A1C